MLLSANSVLSLAYSQTKPPNRPRISLMAVFYETHHLPSRVRNSFCRFLMATRMTYNLGDCLAACRVTTFCYLLKQEKVISGKQNIFKIFLLSFRSKNISLKMKETMIKLISLLVVFSRVSSGTHLSSLSSSLKCFASCLILHSKPRVRCGSICSLKRFFILLFFHIKQRYAILPSAF